MRVSTFHVGSTFLVRTVLLVAVAALGGLASIPSVALADRPELLWQVPEDGQSGANGVELNQPRGIASDPVSGHVFVADHGNKRIAEFTIWGKFVRAWGWGVRDGANELQVCGPGSVSPTATCQRGLRGVGPGQLSRPIGLAVDSSGDVFVAEGEECTEGTGCELQNFRVQKFDTSAGASEADVEFTLMFGGEVNKTKVAEADSTEAERNLCSAASGDNCGIGVIGAGSSQFSNRSDLDYIVTDQSDDVLVGDVGRIQRFTADGEYLGSITGDLAGEQIRALAIDAGGDLYASFSSEFHRSKDDVRKIGSSGHEAQSYPVVNPGAVTVDAQGNVYAVEVDGFVSGKRARVVKFSPDGDKLIPDRAEEREIVESNLRNEPLPHFAEVHSNSGDLLGLEATNACGVAGSDLYVSSAYGQAESFLTAYGDTPNPILCMPPAVPPTIADQIPAYVLPNSANVRARINPHFWPDTTFHVEYGTAPCSQGGCTLRDPIDPEEISLGDRIVSAPILSPTVTLSGLTPSTTYYFRFVASSGGGGPAVGLGIDEEESTFVTPAPRLPTADACMNASLRTGPAAFLPDCRAYERVSPIDKSGGEIYNLINPDIRSAELAQSAADGDGLTYSAYRAFGGAESAPYASQYLATRDPAAGWHSTGISPPRGLPLLGNVGLDAEYKAFSSDLCQSWLLHDTDPVLAPGAVEGFANLYRRSSCGGRPSFEAVTTTIPKCRSPESYAPMLQGMAADPRHVVLRVADRLTDNAAPCDVSGIGKQCYDVLKEKVRLLSILPDGTASTQNCSLGTMYHSWSVTPRYAQVEHALSADGSRAFWSASYAESEPGTLYLRSNPSRVQSNLSGGVCTEATKACTIEVSSTVSSAPATYWGANPKGTRVLFSFGNSETLSGALYEAEIVEQGNTLVARPALIAGEGGGVMGMSDDAESVYLVSGEALATGASGGAPNLYLYRRGAAEPFRFIATLSASEPIAARPGLSVYKFPSPVNPSPNGRTARVSGDGNSAAFMSLASLTGFDNRDAWTGEPDAEVYHYDARGSGTLSCVSCPATGARPSGREMVIDGQKNGVRAAAQIARGTGIAAPRVLAEDGSRLFFESYVPLVPDDTNGMQDVYQWEAVGAGTCSAASPAYSESNGGCISLMSSGKSSQDSRFIDASSDGRDIFFTTGESLLKGDPGWIDIYDARIGGGFPESSPPVACKGEACQPPPHAPHAPTPASSTYVGPGNVKSNSTKPRKKQKKKKRQQKKRRQKARSHRSVGGSR